MAKNKKAFCSTNNVPSSSGQLEALVSLPRDLVLNYFNQISQFRLELYNIIYAAPNIPTADRKKVKATLDRFNELTRNYEDEIKKTYKRQANGSRLCCGTEK
jgi:hypothetical protein